MSAAFSSIAVDIAFLALIWVTNSWKRPVIEGTRRRYRFEGVLTIGGMLGALGWRPRGEPAQGTQKLWRIPFVDEVIIAA